jgi:hypothetical protein
MLSQYASSLLMLAGVAVAVYLLMRRSGQTVLQPDSEPEGERFRLSAPRSRDRALADAPDDVLRWQVEMHETARDLKAEIDTKLAALQALVILARQESERLERALLRAEGIDLTAPRDTLAAIESLADPAALADPDRLARLAAQMPALPGGLRSDLFAENDHRVAIAQLAEQGLAPAEIARRLRIPLGEVELLLNLRSA